MRTERIVESTGLAELDRAETLIVAKQAARWMSIISSGKIDDSELSRAFCSWLRASPLHVRELLLALTWEDALSVDVDPERRVRIEQLVRANRAGSNVRLLP